MRLSIQGNANAIVKDLKIVNKDIQRAATTTALNKTNDKIFSRSVRQVANATGIPRKYLVGQKAGVTKTGRVKEKLSGTMRKYRATWRKPTAKTWMGLKKKIPVIKLVRNAKGIGKYAHYAKGSMHGKTAADAFMAKMPTGHEGLFVRQGRARLPIQEVKLDLSSIAQSTISRVGNAIGPKEFEKQFTYDLKRRLKRKGGAVAARRRLN